MAGKKSASSKALALERVEPLIREIRGEKVILDTDLAQIYGIPTFRLNEAIKRNKNRFPPDFMFQLSQAEFEALKSRIAISETEGTANSSQIAMSSRKHRGTAYRPYAFTEHGAQEIEDDGEPFEEKMKRLTVELEEQFAESSRLERAIRRNLDTFISE